PCSETRMNRELIRLLAYLDEPSVIPALLRELGGKASDVEKLHAALCARFITRGWTTDQRLALLEFYEQVGHQEGGHSFAGYIENISKDFFAQFDDDQRRRVLAEGERWPTAALSVLATIEKPSPQIVSQLIQLDQQLAGFDNDAARKLQTGIIAVLSSSNSNEAFQYLRRAYERWPERRDELAMGLAQSPGGENWPILLRSLSVVDGMAAEEVLAQLSKANQTTTEPEPVRQVILCGLRLKDSGGQHAVALLNKWVGTNVNESDDAWDAALTKWQEWYVRTYPDAIPAELPVESETSKWTYQELTAFLNSDEAVHGQASRGAIVFDKAQCVRCHRFGGRGEGIGPDLSTVGQRFQKKEILQSIIHPSQVISDQYASKTVTTVKGRSYTGIVGSGGPAMVIVLQPNGEKVAIAKDQIDEIAPSPKSAMPDGLLDTLTLDEIADLFAYLTAQPSRVTQRSR
ncbi:MAG TPA: c-type cytochrome, partial [Pirellulales bacterium]|nr:c-type cytochrome [Pirellulales bacterium]